MHTHGLKSVKSKTKSKSKWNHVFCKFPMFDQKKKKHDKKR